MQMPLSPGDKLGPYEIVARLGAGGMGEVYKARDTRLDRTVAVKVLPKSIAATADSRARFEREARAVSGLKHPNICVLHDIGQQDNIDFIVLEHLEGETLAARVRKGPMPLDQVLKYAPQVADALDRAHRSGICHRDVKPANIMLTRDGAKVLDFGLAKTATQAIGQEDETGLMEALTDKGKILGTPQYMAPEQYEGKPDARSDIFAFGCVVFEMVTGKRCFDGKTHASLIAAVLGTDPPPMNTLAPVTPAALERVVRRCLAKDPEDRYQSMRDVVLDLTTLDFTANEESGTGPAGKRLRRSLGLSWTVAAGFALLAGAVTTFHFRENPPEAGVTRLSFVPPITDVNNLTFGDLDVSPDGRHIAFGGGAIWLHSMDSLAIEQLPGTEGASRPFWSPDGRSLGFYVVNRLKRIEIGNRNSPAQTIGSSLGWPNNGASWGSDSILYSPEATGTGLYRMPVNGGAPVPVTALNAARHEIAHRFPHFLPDGRHFIYWVWSTVEENTGIYAGSVDPKEKIPEGPLVRTWRDARYADPGYMLYLRGSKLLAQPFDPRRLRLTGEPVFMPDPVGTNFSSTGRALFSVSTRGVLAYQEAPPIPSARLVWRDRAGKELRSVEAAKGPATASLGMSLAPGEKRAVIGADDENALEDLWLVDLERSTSLRLTSSHSSCQSPVWSPDGHHIAFQSNRNGAYDLYLKQPNDGSQEELLYGSSHRKTPTSWSPDGRFLVYSEADPKTGADIWVLPLEGERKPFPFLRTEFNEGLGALSGVPDHEGHLWMAYQSNETGRAEIYVRPFLPGAANGPAGAKVRVSTGGGINPKWRADGRELFYVSKNQIWAVDVSLGATPEIGTPRALFRAENGTVYTPASDGQRFLFFEGVGEAVVPKIDVVLNWTAALKNGN